MLIPLSARVMLLRLALNYDFGRHPKLNQNLANGSSEELIELRRCWAGPIELFKP